MARLGHYDRNGKPISMMEWALLFADHDKNCRVAHDVVQRHGVNVEVSTVWLGIDHNFSADPKAKPLIFETMIFSGEGGPHHEYQHRWHTQIEAIRGHEAIVHAVEDLSPMPFENTNIFTSEGLRNFMVALVGAIDKEHGHEP